MTSNLIAFWGLQEKERELAEELRHNLETEKIQNRKLAIDKALGEFNNQIALFRANEEARHNAAQERISNFSNYLRQQEVNLTALRVESENTYREEQIKIAERKRVDESYFQQRKMNAEDRFREKELEIKAGELALKQSQLDYSKTKDAFEIGWKGLSIALLGPYANKRRLKYELQ